MKFWRTLDGARGTLRSYIEKLAIDSKEFIEMYLKIEFSCRFYSRTKKRKKKKQKTNISVVFSKGSKRTIVCNFDVNE